MPEIWAVLEHNEYDLLSEKSGELLAELAEIAQRQQEKTVLCAVLLSAPEDASVDMPLFTTSGVQNLYLLEHPDLIHYSTEGYISALTWLLQRRAPVLIAASATVNGRDWMPRLAARLHLPFVPGCLGLDVHDDAIFALRTACEARAYVQSRTELHGRTGLATFVPGTRGIPHASRKSNKAEIIRLTPEIPASFEHGRIHRLAIQAPSPEEVDLESAERIVAGGRGVGRQGFASIAAFAHVLHATVGATRVATDKGWVEHARQIGTTGKSVHPKLYIACGISGAAQHTAGMRDAQTVVAINPDRTAPIFTLADLGLLGDANAILPLAAKQIEQS